MQEQLINDLKQALRDGDSTAVSVLRMLKSELHNAHIAQGSELTEDDTIKVIRKEVKKRNEAAAAFQKAGNTERAASEEAEAAILSRYLPAQADAAVVEAFAREAFAQLPDHTPRQKGVLIQQVLQKFNGQVDGSTVAAMVNTLFSEQA
jgi:uncharacterized protein YqeY